MSVNPRASRKPKAEPGANARDPGCSEGQAFPVCCLQKGDGTVRHCLDKLSDRFL